MNICRYMRNFLYLFKLKTWLAYPSAWRCGERVKTKKKRQLEIIVVAPNNMPLNENSEEEAEEPNEKKNQAVIKENRLIYTLFISLNGSSPFTNFATLQLSKPPTWAVAFNLVTISIIF